VVEHDEHVVRTVAILLDVLVQALEERRWVPVLLGRDKREAREAQEPRLHTCMESSAKSSIGTEKQ
jgi:hypothetical protein